MPINSGELDTEISLSHRSLMRNSQGEQLATFPKAYAITWAKKRDTRGQKRFASQEFFEEKISEFTLRWRGDIVATDRLTVLEDGTVYEIVQISEIPRMSVSALLNILNVDIAVTSFVGVGAEARITPIMRTQDQLLPAVTLSVAAVNPLYTLNGPAGMDENRFQVDSWAKTYAEASALAGACRDAIEASGFVMLSELDNFDASAELSGTYCVTQEYSLWI
jgi:head-tail adaptor